MYDVKISVMTDLWCKVWRYDRFMVQRAALWQFYGVKSGVMTDLWCKEWRYDRFMV